MRKTESVQLLAIVLVNINSNLISTDFIIAIVIAFKIKWLLCENYQADFTLWPKMLFLQNLFIYEFLI